MYANTNSIIVEEHIISTQDGSLHGCVSNAGAERALSCPGLFHFLVRRREHAQHTLDYTLGYSEYRCYTAWYSGVFFLHKGPRVTEHQQEPRARHKTLLYPFLLSRNILTNDCVSKTWQECWSFLIHWRSVQSWFQAERFFFFFFER